MNMREDIRNVMLAHGSPMRPLEVIHALPQYNPQRIREAIGDMFRWGILSRVQIADRLNGYYASRNVKLKRYETEEARQAATRERELIRNRRRRGGGSLEELRAKQAENRRLKALERRLPPSKAHRVPLAEFQAQQAAKREAKAAHRAAEAEKRARKRAAEAEAARLTREARKRKPMSAAQKVFTQTPAAIKAWPAMTLPPPPAKPRPESVEEFLANGGEIQVLPGIQVKPLTYGGHRDQNNDSMRRSLHE